VPTGGKAARAKPVTLRFGEAGRRFATLKASDSTDRKIAAALERGSVTATVTAKFSDKLGNIRTLKRKIRLR
jgi:hypothetical protein